MLRKYLSLNIYACVYLLQNLRSLDKSNHLSTSYFI